MGGFYREFDCASSARTGDRNRICPGALAPCGEPEIVVSREATEGGSDETGRHVSRMPGRLAPAAARSRRTTRDVSHDRGTSYRDATPSARRFGDHQVGAAPGRDGGGQL